VTTIPFKSALPNGDAHVRALMAAEAGVRLVTTQYMPDYYLEFELIGTSLNVLYQAATCERMCHGGGHFFEGLCGRAYNIGQAALNLAMSGLYDEALSLVRGLGEISNLIALSGVDPGVAREWIRSDKKARMKKFGPAEVRRRLEKIAPDLMFANKDWYGDLSERFTHPSPGMQPGRYGEGGIIGGSFQKAGLEEAIGETARTLCVLALFVCKFEKFDDLHELLGKQMTSAIAHWRMQLKGEGSGCGA
jgi:hypothetical protein